MPFDALFLSALTAELTPTLLGARIDKIQMPAREPGGAAIPRPGPAAGRLLLSAAPGSPRLHLTAIPLPNPAQPPIFLYAAAQAPLRRTHHGPDPAAHGAAGGPPAGVAWMSWASRPEKHLILEMMGRGAN